MRTSSRILLAVGVGAVAIVRYFRRPRFDEDRPDMIVRGGSLIFQSGDERASQKGHTWKEVVPGRWTPHQPKGKPAVHLVLTVKTEDGGDVNRRPARDIRIRYSGTGGLESFEITSENGHGPVRIPLVVGDGFIAGGSADYPTIERPGSGNVFSISYRDVDGQTRECQTTQAKIEFFD